MKYRRVPVTVSSIYTLDVFSMKGKILVENKDMFRQNNSDVVDFLEDDPDHILMAFSDTNQLFKDIYRVDITNGRYARIEHQRSGVQYWYTDRRGEPRVGQGRLDHRSKEEIWNMVIRDAKDDNWRDVGEYPGLKADVPVFGFTRNPNELIIGDRVKPPRLYLPMITSSSTS
jgi:hypothetical protein